MKKVLIFDIGPEETGLEIDWFVGEIFPNLGIIDYQIHGFEPCMNSFLTVFNKFKTFPNITIHHLAINNYEGRCKLYHAVGPAGHSIFETKINVPDTTDFEEVGCSRLSKWIRDNIKISEWEDSIKILRFNCEGAEWPLIEDLNETGILKEFDIVCGNLGGDITTCSELNGRYEDYQGIMIQNNINQLYFCYTGTDKDKTSIEDMKNKLKELCLKK